MTKKGSSKRINVKGPYAKVASYKTNSEYALFFKNLTFYTQA